MCTPVALGFLSFAVQGAQAVAAYSAQKQQYEDNKKSAEAAWRVKQTQITQRQMQEEDALRQKQAQQNIEEAQAKAETEASAAASGVAGISVDNLLAEVGRRASYNRRIAQDNTDMIISQLTLERKGINAEAQSRINSVSQPSPLSLIAGLGGAALGGFKTYTSQQQMT